MYFPCLDEKLFCEIENMKKYLSETKNQSYVYHSRMFLRYSVYLYWSLQHLYHGVGGERYCIDFWSLAYYNFSTFLPSVLKGSFNFFSICLLSFLIFTWWPRIFPDIFYCYMVWAFNNSSKYIKGYGAFNHFLYFPKCISKLADELFLQKSVV